MGAKGRTWVSSTIVGAAASLALLIAIGSCAGKGGHGGIPPVALDGEYVIFAWNDLGMHCLNPTYDQAVLLPPYNTVWVQVVKRGNPPEIVTANVVVDYRIVGNTTSYGKTDARGGIFAQFWDNAEALFGAAGLAHDTGLNLDDPSVHNGLTGTMAATADHFHAHGIPVTPVDDAGAWNPYQVIEVTAKDTAGNVLATTRTTIPTSDEIDCAKCHGSNALGDVLAKHDPLHGTTLVDQAPVLCASCHGTPALGTSGPGAAGKYLSEAIHGSHASRGAACYDCHPGTETKCSRSIAHATDDGNCVACHGTLGEVSGSIASGDRIPWAEEPECSDCHAATIAEVDTGDTLYRNATGHGGMYCAACHSSPHAMLPTTQASDGYTAVMYQGVGKTIGSCGACHATSKGPGDEVEEYGEAHGGSSPEVSNACFVCHTSVSTNTASWPHAFEWMAH